MFKIQPDKLNEYFTILGFKKELSDSGAFYIWEKEGYHSFGISVVDTGNTKSHKKYYIQNLQILKDNTGYNDDFPDGEFEDIITQNKYTIYNRAETDDNSLPNDYFSNSLNAIINTFKVYAKSSNLLKNLKFSVEIGHTKKGSFVTPIYLVPDKEAIESYIQKILRPDETALFEAEFIQNNFGRGLDNFFTLLNTLETLNDLDERAKLLKIQELGLSSDIIETFLGENSEYQKSIQKYKDKIKVNSFGLDFTPIIDYPLEDKTKRIFKTAKLQPIKPELIDQIKIEEDLRDSNLNERNAKLRIRVYSMEIEKFTCLVRVCEVHSNKGFKHIEKPIIGKIDLKNPQQFEIYNKLFITQKECNIIGDIFFRKGWKHSRITLIETLENLD
ncbi:MAG: hypothetical protein ACRCZ2_05205 [Fusobacteriaceae bacterium]